MTTIKVSKERREAAIKSLKGFFREERDEDISDFQAAILFDFILNDTGVYIYNQALEDAHHFIREKLEDIYGLEKQPAHEVRR